MFIQFGILYSSKGPGAGKSKHIPWLSKGSRKKKSFLVARPQIALPPPLELSGHIFEGILFRALKKVISS